MTLPLAVTTISILRPGRDATLDPGTDSMAAPTTVASGVRAVIGSPGGSERQVSGAEQSDVAYRVWADVCDLGHRDRVVDSTTGVTYEVAWVERRYGFGLDHMVGGLRIVSGTV